MKDFKYIFSPQVAEQIIGYGDNAKSYFVYSYLMHHQYCPIVIFKPKEIIFVLKEAIDGIKDINYKEDTGEYVIAKNEGYLSDIEDVLKDLSFQISSKYIEGDIITLKIESIFSNEEVEINRKRFEGYY